MSADRWNLAELVAIALMRRAEADRGLLAPVDHIFIEEIWPGSSRASSRIEQHASVAIFMARYAAEHGRAFCLLQRSEQGWQVHDFGHCRGSVAEVNASLAKLCGAAAP